MTPDELLNPENLPEDLHWLKADYKLNPDDPVYLLIAWHWLRAKAGEDSLRAATVELKKAVDSRIEKLLNAGEVVAGLKEHLAAVQAELEKKPLRLAERLEADLRQPVAAAVERVQGLEKTLAALLRAAEIALGTAQRRQALAAFVIGAGLGAVVAVLCR